MELLVAIIIGVLVASGVYLCLRARTCLLYTSPSPRDRG